MHTYQIKFLILFVVSSTCFAHHVFVIRNTILHAVFYGIFFMRLCKQSSRWKDVLDTQYRAHPDDEHMMFETCRRHQVLN